MIAAGMCQLPGLWLSARISSSPPVYYFVCFTHLQRKMVARLSTAMTDGSLGVCVCFFFTSLLLREASAREDQYSTIVLPPH